VGGSGPDPHPVRDRNEVRGVVHAGETESVTGGVGSGYKGAQRGKRSRELTDYGHGHNPHRVDLSPSSAIPLVVVVAMVVVLIPVLVFAPFRSCACSCFRQR